MAVRGRRQGAKMSWTYLIPDIVETDDVRDKLLRDSIQEDLNVIFKYFLRVENFNDSNHLLTFKLNRVMPKEAIESAIKDFYHTEIEPVEDNRWKYKVHDKNIYGFGKAYEDAKRGQFGHKHIYITIPKFSMPIDNLKNKVNIYFYQTYNVEVVSQLWAIEYHQDGSPHMHGIVEFNIPIYIDHRDFNLNVLDGKTAANIGKCRNLIQCIKYCLKDIDAQHLSNYYADGNFIQYLEEKKAKLELGNQKRPRGSKDKVLLKAIELIEKKGISVQQVYSQFQLPHERLIILQNIRILQNCITCIGNCTEKLDLDIPDEPDDTDLKIIWNWLINLISGRLRIKEDRHLFITGESMIGKSSFIRYIENLVRVYKIDNSAWFNPNYSDGQFDLAICDEFTPNTDKKITDLNLFLRGSNYDTFEVKHSFITKKDNRLPCLFISNYTKRDIEYTLNSHEGKAFIKRFGWVELGFKQIPLQLRDYYAINHKSKSTQTDPAKQPMLLYSEVYNETSIDYLLYNSPRSNIEFIGVYPDVAPERFDFKKDDYILLMDPINKTPLRRLVIEETMDIQDTDRNKSTQADILETYITYSSILYYPSTDDTDSCNSRFYFERSTTEDFYMELEPHLTDIIWSMIDNVINTDSDSEFIISDEEPMIPSYPFEDFINYAFIFINQGDCSICFDENIESKRLMLHCRHVFHVQCMRDWYNSKKELVCPLCKTIYYYGIQYIPLLNRDILSMEMVHINILERGLFVFNKCHEVYDEECGTCKFHKEMQQLNLFGICQCEDCVLVCQEEFIT